MLVMTGLGVTLALAADPKQEDPATADRKLWAAISVTAPILDWDASTGRPFMVYFALVNDGAKAVNPEVEASQLLVNGKELEDWSFIISNGPRDARWKKLPAEDYLNFAYNLGKYFEKPGIYKVLWKGKGFQSPELVFRVMPKKSR
jgi:hypothetical protein